MSATSSVVTRPQAEAVLAKLIKRYKSWLEPVLREDGSVLIEAPSELDRPFLRDRENGSWEIVWESGPDEWAYRFTSGGINEEFAYELHHEFGLSMAEAGRRATEQPTQLSAKLSVEPCTSYSVGIWVA